MSDEEEVRRLENKKADLLKALDEEPPFNQSIYDAERLSKALCGNVLASILLAKLKSKNGISEPAGLVVMEVIHSIRMIRCMKYARNIMDCEIPANG